MNPCAAAAGTNPCGQNAECKVVLHRAICNCPLGYFGNPITVRRIDASLDVKPLPLEAASLRL